MDLLYRGGTISAVPATCLAHEIETRVWAQVNIMAVESGVLQELHAEQLLGFATDLNHKALNISSEFLLKVGCVDFLCLSIDVFLKIKLLF